MNPAKCVFERVGGVDGLGHAAEAWTKRLAPRICWPEGTRFEGIRLARLWVSGDATLTFEHEITLRDAAEARALRIQGRTIKQTWDRPDRLHAHVRYGGLMGLCVDDPASRLHWCSPDRDRALAMGPLFQRAVLADWLQTRIASADHVLVSVPQTPLAYRLITHRLGKRCVIRVRKAEGESPGLFVKAYAHRLSPRQIAEAATARGIPARRDKEANSLTEPSRRAGMRKRSCQRFRGSASVTVHRVKSALALQKQRFR